MKNRTAEEVLLGAIDKSKIEIKKLLIEIFPESREAIEFQAKENFKEWAGILFDLPKWNLTNIIDFDIRDFRLKLNNKQRRKILSSTTKRKVEDKGVISLVHIGEEFHIIDGYHRVFISEGKGDYIFNACVWQKVKNNNPKSLEVKQLILKNI